MKIVPQYYIHYHQFTLSELDEDREEQQPHKTLSAVC